ncbi:MAG: hypothetical protein WC373_11810 [Smithella sp.]|jgi:hypothetical protein
MPRWNKRKAVEEEFDEPFADVVKGFADFGYSMKFTAGLLGYHEEGFRQLVHKEGWRHYFKAQRDMVPECRSGNRKGMEKPKIHTDEYLLSLVRQYPRYTDFITYSPVAKSTIWTRFGGLAEARKLAGIDLGVAV